MTVPRDRDAPVCAATDSPDPLVALHARRTSSLLDLHGILCISYHITTRTTVDATTIAHRDLERGSTEFAAAGVFQPSLRDHFVRGRLFPHWPHRQTRPVQWYVQWRSESTIWHDVGHTMPTAAMMLDASALAMLEREFDQSMVEVLQDLDALDAMAVKPSSSKPASVATVSTHQPSPPTIGSIMPHLRAHIMNLYSAFVQALEKARFIERHSEG